MSRDVPQGLPPIPSSTIALSTDDAARMAQAVALAERCRGQTGDNPNVGAVLYQGARLVGRGATGEGGRPHAEVQALEQAGAAVRGATAYVTLEPCCHEGRSGACTRALIAAGVARVVFAVEDPNPLVAGKGAAALRAAGIVVQQGLEQAAAQRAMAGFLTRMTLGRPHVTLKLASSLDARSALANGQSQWITDSNARLAGHLLRAQSDALLVGAATFLADRPQLTARLPGLTRYPLRFLLDPRGQVPQQSGWTHLATRDLPQALVQIAAQGVNWLMVESGGRLAAALIAQRLVDALWWASGDQLLGGDSRSAVGELGLQALAHSPRFERLVSRQLGRGRLDIYEPLQDKDGPKKDSAICLPD